MADIPTCVLRTLDAMKNLELLIIWTTWDPVSSELSMLSTTKGYG